MGKMSPLGWAHHYPLPKYRAKSGVAAEPMIMADYATALPGAQHSPCPLFKAPSSPRPWGQHQGNKIPQYTPRFRLLRGWPGSLRASQGQPAGESLWHLFPEGLSARQPLPDSQWDQEGAWQLQQRPMTL